MTVDSWCAAGREYGAGRELAAEREVVAGLARALQIAVLCNEARLGYDGAEGRGSSTESALLSAARLAGLDYRDERRRHPLRDIRRRGERDHWMATAHDEDGRLLIAMKGAPQQVIVRRDRWPPPGVPGPL